MKNDAFFLLKEIWTILTLFVALHTFIYNKSNGRGGFRESRYVL